MILKKIAVLILFYLSGLFVLPSYAQLSLISDQQIDFSIAVSSTKSGNWNDTAVWSNGQIPTATTDVIIEDGHRIYINKQGATSGQIVDLCRNIQIKPTAILQMGHDTANFAKDLRINGSILCNGTFSSGRNQPQESGTGLIYAFNSRVFLNLTHNDTYISGSGFFNPRSLNISSNSGTKNLTIDLYNLLMDDNFTVKSNNRVKVTITKYAYVRAKKALGLTGSTHQFSAPSSKSNLIIEGIVVTGDLSLFTKNATLGESSSITINNQGSLYTLKINNGDLNRKSEAGGFNFTINSGGLFRIGQNINFNNLTSNNPNFTFNNNGELRKHYSETIASSAQITSKIDANNPDKGHDVSQIKDVFGASHIAGWYNFTDKPFMIEGLDKYKEFGSSALKTTLSPINNRMSNAYPFNHTFPRFETIKEVAQHKYMDSLFKRKHIKTHTFWTVTRNQSNYKKGPDFNHDSFLSDEQQFYDLTKYLLETYGDMAKKFIYQNWEGDWMLRGSGVLWEINPSLIPDDVDWRIEGMARMFRARQRGTERARNEHLDAKAKVFNGIEFNKLWMQKNGNRITMMDNGTPNVIANVVPLTRVDLTSWSAYDGAWTNENNPHGHALWKGLEMAKYFTTETGAMNIDFPVQVGEFAINENPPRNGNNTAPVIRSRYGSYIGVALGLGIPNFYLWNLYCSGAQDAPNGFTWERGVQYDTDFLYQWMDGKWLIEPDGSWGTAATYLMDQWENSLSTTDALTDNQSITLYPNPTSYQFKIEGISKSYQLTIFDINGRKIIEQQSKGEEIDTSTLKKGIYMVLIKDENNKVFAKKLMIN
jgi:hypothetical protein